MVVNVVENVAKAWRVTCTPVRLVVTDDWCWGYNLGGQLGTGDVDHDPVPTAVLVELLPSARLRMLHSGTRSDGTT